MKGFTYSKKRPAFKVNSIKRVGTHCEQIMHIIAPFSSSKKIEDKTVWRNCCRKTRHVLPRGKSMLKMQELGW